MRTQQNRARPDALPAPASAGSRAAVLRPWRGGWFAVSRGGLCPSHIRRGCVVNQLGQQTVAACARREVQCHTMRSAPGRAMCDHILWRLGASRPCSIARARTVIINACAARGPGPHATVFAHQIAGARAFIGAEGAHQIKDHFDHSSRPPACAATAVCASISSCAVNTSHDCVILGQRRWWPAGYRVLYPGRGRATSICTRKRSSCASGRG